MRNLFLVAVVGLIALLHVNSKQRSESISVEIDDIPAAVAEDSTTTPLVNTRGYATVTIETEPEWCVPCRAMEMDGVVESLLRSGWDVSVVGSSGGPVPKITVRIGDHEESITGYRGREQLFRWVRQVSSSAKR